MQVCAQHDISENSLIFVVCAKFFFRCVTCIFEVCMANVEILMLFGLLGSEVIRRMESVKSYLSSQTFV
jgi:hypothetical protein